MLYFTTENIRLLSRFPPNLKFLRREGIYHLIYLFYSFLHFQPLLLTDTSSYLEYDEAYTYNNIWELWSFAMSQEIMNLKEKIQLSSIGL